MKKSLEKLPELAEEYELTQDQVEQYQRDGHIVLRQVCSRAEIEAFRPHIRGAVEDYAGTQKRLAERDTYGKAFLQVGHLWGQNEAAKKFVFARRFAQIAARLAKANAIRLYHDQALFKEGGGGITPWHQDQHYWPLDTNQSITLWMPLTDISPEMGAVCFASGSHKNGYLGNMAISDKSEAFFTDYVKQQGFEIYQSGDMQAGDASFHNGWTLHGAIPNKTDRMREAMTIIYYPDGTQLTEPDHEHRQIDFDAVFPGMQPGQAAASALTPILYSE